MSKYDNLRLENQIVFPLYLCSKELIRRYTVYLKEIDLTYTQYIVMTFFWEKYSFFSKEPLTTRSFSRSTANASFLNEFVIPDAILNLLCDWWSYATFI
jgi:hypothetical protein